DAQRLEVVLAQCCESDVAVGERRDLRALGGMGGISRLAVAGRALDVGDVLHAEERQLSGRQVSNSFALVHLILSTTVEARSWVWAGAPLAERGEPLVISIERTRLSTSGRTRSMCSSPLSSRAPLTSMPSARTNERWNWRA